jgi:signal transduction histidine kinase
MSTRARPSSTLARRVVLALLLSFGVVYLLQLGLIYTESNAPGAAVAQLRTRGDALLAAIDKARDPHEACAVIAGAVAIENMERAPGRAAFAALAARTGADVCADALPVKRVINGIVRAGDTEYAGYIGTSARWQLRMLSLKRDGRWLFGQINRRMLPYFALSFLVVGLPIWFAVARGLRPLRVLSERIAARSPDDLTPLGAAPSYAELAPLTAAIDGLLSQLRAKVEREHAFVQDAAHELRTPLAALTVQAHAVAATHDAVERTTAARQLDQVVQRASHLIGQLLELARLGGAASGARRVDVVALVRGEIALVAPAAIAAGIDVSLDGPEGLTVISERDALIAIVANLLNNAVRYVPAGGRVAVQVRQRDGATEVEVADDGPGIAPELRALVFERFFRGRHDADGTGLGLAIVRAAAARAGGRVRLDDGIAGRGVAFVLELPGSGGAGDLTRR